MRNQCFIVLITAGLFAGCGDSDEANIVEQTKVSAKDAASQQTRTDASKSADESLDDLVTVDPKQVAELVQSALEEANDQIKKRQFNQAVQTLNRVARMDPNEPEAFMRLAGIYADAGQNVQALSNFSKAISLAPKNHHYLNTRGFFLMSRKVYNDAITDFTEAINVNPKYTQAFNNRGLCWISMGNTAKAVEDLDAAIKIDPKYADALNNRGFAFYRDGDYEKALIDFNAALAADPKYLSAYSNRGMLHMKTGDFEKAVFDFTEAIARSRSDIRFYAFRREAYLKLERKDEAKADAEKIVWLRKLDRLNKWVAQDPKDPKTYIQRASHLIEGGEEKIALTNYEQAIKADPQYAQAYSARAAHWYKQGEYQKALEDCDKALALERHHEAYSVRGDAYLKLGDYDRAIADYDASKRFDVTVAQAYFLRAKKHQEIGNNAQAAKDFDASVTLDPSLAEQAIKANPKCAKAYSARAAQWYKQGDFEQALDDCNKAIELEKHHEAYSVRGDTYLKLGDYDRAIADYDVSKRFDVTVAQAYFLRAKRHRENGNAAQAAKDLEAAIELDPSLRDAGK